MRTKVGGVVQCLSPHGIVLLLVFPRAFAFSGVGFARASLFRPLIGGGLSLRPPVLSTPASQKSTKMGLWPSREETPPINSFDLDEHERQVCFSDRYSHLTGQKVLVVGDGNLSFSLALRRVCRDIELYATTYDSRDFVQNRYASRTIVQELESSGAHVHHEVDATDIAKSFGDTFRVHVIIFNFPHHPGKGMIHRNRELIRKFFESAAKHLEKEGEVRVSLAQGQGGTPVDKPRVWGDHWQLTAQAAHAGLVLKSVQEFVPAPEYTSCGYKSMNKEFRLEHALEHVLVRDDRGITALYPPSWTHDVSFWVKDGFDDDGFVSLARGIEAVVEVELFDSVQRSALSSSAVKADVSDAFVETRTYRVTYRTETRALSQDRARDLQFSLRHKIVDDLGCILR